MPESLAMLEARITSLERRLRRTQTGQCWRVALDFPPGEALVRWFSIRGTDFSRQPRP